MLYQEIVFCGGLVMPQRKFASFVIAVTQWGIPLVTEPSKPAPHFWKVPGGACEGDETPEQSAVREYDEEVGEKLSVQDLVLVRKEEYRTHDRYFFRVDCREVNPKGRGEEGEIIEVFPPHRVEELLRDGKILAGHCEVLRVVLASLG